MFITRSLILLSLLVALPRTATAQVLTQPLPPVGHQSSFQVSQATSPLPFARLREEERVSGLEAFLTGAAVGAALGLVASPFVTCTYSTDRSCPVKTMGISALAIGLIALSATF